VSRKGTRPLAEARRLGSGTTNESTLERVGKIALAVVSVLALFRGRARSVDAREPATGATEQPTWATYVKAALAIVPVLALLGGGVQFLLQQSDNTRQLRSQQNQTTLDNYLNQMSTMILNYNLPATKKGTPVNNLAIGLTDTTVRDLDGGRRGTLIRYLWEQGLINVPVPVLNLYVIDLNRVDFAEANLFGIDLATDFLTDADLAGARAEHADLSGVDMYRADLRGTNLTGADLSCTNDNGYYCSNLTDADLSDANLEGANLEGADLSGVKLKGVKYNRKSIQVTIEGITSTIPATTWPYNFGHLNARGAICEGQCA
jgi:Pentapeptide repeats (8 copies)